MRRKTTQIKSPAPHQICRGRKHKTYLDSKCVNNQHPNQKNNLLGKSTYAYAETIANLIIGQIFSNNFEKELQRIQLQKIVSRTMNHCASLFNNQNWQINPVGPFTQRNKQPQIKPDQQPKVRTFDPMLGFDKSKSYKANKIHTQSSIALSHKKNSHFKQINILKPSALNFSESRRSFRSNKSSTSQENVNRNSKLIPLKLQNRNTPPEQISSRRNLQDFLRDMKANRSGNAQADQKYKLKILFQQKQNLKTIQQFQKSSLLLKTARNLFAQINEMKTSNDLSAKLPFFSSRQECATDYDAGAITLKKQSKHKKCREILKGKYKFLNQPGQLDKKQAIKKTKQKNLIIKLTPLFDQKRQSYSEKILTTRVHTQNDMKNRIEQNMHQNKVYFRQLGQTQRLFTLFQSPLEDQKVKYDNKKSEQNKKSTNEKAQIVKKVVFA